jgi:hypothetical protein
MTSVWAAATRVTTATVGAATSQRRATCPGPRAPISTTTASTPSSAFSRVSGTPSSLLNDPTLAAVRRRDRRAAASRSLTDVFPTDPVTPTTRSGSRRRAARPRSSSAAAVSSTTTAVPPTGSRAVR